MNAVEVQTVDEARTVAPLIVLLVVRPADFLLFHTLQLFRWIYRAYSRLKHFIIQQMHKYIIRRYN